MILTNEEIIFFESHPEITISELLKYPIEMYKKMEEGNLLKTDEETLSSTILKEITKQMTQIKNEMLGEMSLKSSEEQIISDVLKVHVENSMKSLKESLPEVIDSKFSVLYSIEAVQKLMKEKLETYIGQYEVSRSKGQMGENYVEQALMDAVQEKDHIQKRTKVIIQVIL